MEQENQQKIPLVEIVLLTLVCGGTDLFEILASFLSLTVVLAPAFLVLNWLFDGLCWISLIVWLIIRRIKGVWVITGNLFELIPGLDALPIRTATLWLTIFLVNRPVKVPGMEKAIQIAIKK